MTEIAHIEAEQALLGILLYDAEALQNVGEHLQAEHFIEPFHGWMYETVRKLAGEGRQPDPMVIADRASELNAFHTLGGARYIADLVDRAPASQAIIEYAGLIFDAAQRRDLLAACREYSRAAQEFRSIPAYEIASEMRARIEEIERGAAPASGSLKPIVDFAREAIRSTAELAQNGRARGALTGLRCFDRRFGGLLDGKLIIIGGRPGMGKTGLLRAGLHGAAVRNPDELFLLLSAEMGGEEMSLREMSAITHELEVLGHGEAVQYENMLKGKVTPLELQMMDSAAERIPPNLLIEYVPGLTMEEYQRRVWAVRRMGRLRAVGIDYLQIMRRPEMRGRTDSAILGDMTSMMKQMAGKLGFCTLLLSQINRSVEARDDKKPTIADLRESGAIEQDADAILFPYREYYYLKDREPKGKETRADHDMKLEETKNLMEVICAKWRSGATGIDKQTYLAPYDIIQDREA